MDLNSDTMGMLASYGPIVVMVVIFYFLLYKPQKKEQKRRKGMLETLKKGNRIMTIGGIYGEIVSLNENTVKVKIADKVEIEVARASVSANISQEKNPADK
jgi:preprotein translocase subunit YajC